MANSLGSLVVRLGLDAAEFTSGLTKSEKEAQAFARRIDQGISTAASIATAGLVAMAGAAVAAFAAINSLAKQAGDFQDLAEKTGANAEALASFSVSAQVAGTNIASVAEATVKLTKNLTGVDDESKAAGAALAALNIPIKDFKALDPATQLEVVAKALAGFEDGASKTAVALALFGKSGAELLPFLKELATGAGRVVILNEQLIKQADDYSDKQARARAELNLYAQVAASQALPAITALIGASKDFIAELIGMDANGKKLRDSRAIADFAENAVIALAAIIDQADAFIRTFQVVGNVIGATAAQLGAVARGDLAAYNAIQKDASDTIDAIINKQGIRARLEQRISEQRKNDALRGTEDRGFTPPGKALNFAGPVKDTGALKERTSEAQRYLEALTRTAERLAELSTVEQLLADIQKGRLKGLTPELSAQLFLIAEQIDAEKALTKEVEAGKKAFDEDVRAQEAEAKARSRITKAAFDEAEAIKNANRNLKDEIAIIEGGDEARKKIEKDRVSGAIANKEYELSLIAITDATKSEREAIESQIQFLKERQTLLVRKDFAEALAADKKAAEEFGNALSDSFSNAFEGFIQGTKSAKDAFKQFASDVEAMLIKLALQNLGKSIFGGSAGGPDIFSLLSKFLGSFGGGAGVSAGAGIELGSLATGTDNWRGGPTWVGENGPEILNLPKGAQVIPIDSARKNGGGATVINHIHPPPGADTRSMRQFAGMVRDMTVRSMKDR